VIIPLEKLIAYNQNRYIFSRATMVMVDKIGNIKEYPEEDTNWKVVPNILLLALNETIKFKLGVEE
jgi:hypothetical protein